MTSIDIAWAAGFIEGEGAFSVLRAKGRVAGTPSLTASQVQQEPLRRLVRTFGGKIYGPYENGGNHAPYYRWTLYGRRAVGAMFTIFTFLSRKRRDQAVSIIDAWKHQPGQGARNARKTHCPRGHAYSVENTYVYQGRRACRACVPMRHILRQLRGPAG